MNEKILKTLEYDKIQQALLGQVVTANGRRLVQAMQPLTDPVAVQQALDETADGASALRLKAVFRCRNSRILIRRLNESTLGPF